MESSPTNVLLEEIDPNNRNQERHEDQYQYEEFRDSHDS
jgi:hypothetical protein